MNTRMFFALIAMVGLVTSVNSQVLDCNFDTAVFQDTVLPCMCRGSPCELEQSSNDQFDWITYRGSTASSDTGPEDDHTRQDGTGIYIYSEASDENPGNTAAISTPPIVLSQTSCLSFWYHMYGQHIGDLEVIVTYFNGSSATIWDKTGDQGNQWLEAKMLLPTTVTMVTINTNRGGTATGMPYGDIALDDIGITEVICAGFTAPPPPATTTTTTESTSTQAGTTSVTTSTPLPSSQPSLSTTQSPSSMSPTTSSPPTQTSTYSQTSEVSSTGSTTKVSATPGPSSSAVERDTTTTFTSTVSDTSVTTTVSDIPTSDASVSSTNQPVTRSTVTIDTTTRSPGSEMKLWGLDETLWIIILVVGGAVILILLVIVCIQACAMRRMRTARIVRQSDDYSNIEAYSTPRPNKPQDNFINAYDNMGMEHEDKNNTMRSNGGGLH